METHIDKCPKKPFFAPNTIYGAERTAWVVREPSNLIVVVVVVIVVVEIIIIILIISIMLIIMIIILVT
jgi:hypothetical protein